MTVVAVALVALLAVTVLLSARERRSLVRQQARERELLLNQIMHLAGRTWTPPPADNAWAPPADEVERWTPTPEQFIEV